jgi:hypothetical protein
MRGENAGLYREKAGRTNNNNNNNNNNVLIYLTL